MPDQLTEMYARQSAARNAEIQQAAFAQAMAQQQQALQEFKGQIETPEYYLSKNDVTP